MKKTLLILILASAAASVSAAEYRIDPHHTNARFAIDHFGASTNVGGFYGLNGNVNFDAAKKTGSIDIRIPVSSLQTGSQDFTKHLLSADLFHAEKYPEIRFVSDKFHFSGNKLKAVDGKLTLMGKTLPVRLKADKFNCYDSPILKTQVCGADLSTKIDRTRWGINYLTDVGMSKTVSLQIQIEAGKK